MTEPVKILCLGEAMVEFNQQPDGTLLPGHGGDTSNCAIAATRQGASVGYISQIGADNFGTSLIQLWQREGINHNGVKTISTAKTGVYFVTHSDAGHQFNYLRHGSAASRITPADLPQHLLQAGQILHTSGISQAISTSAADTVFAAIETVKSKGGLISYDPNLRLQLWPIDRARAIIHATAGLSDLLLPGLDDAQQLTGLQHPEAILDFYLTLGAKTVALTLGAAGVMLASSSERWKLPGHQLNSVDATGAGDCFDGAFLARTSAGDDPVEAARYANAAAAIATTGFGAIAPIPRPAQVRQLLADSKLQPVAI